MNSGRTPVRIAHAYGNNRRALERALSADVDLIETDIWFRGGRIWVRHERRLGPLPFLADRRPRSSHSLDGRTTLPFWPGYYARLDLRRYPLEDLLAAAKGKRRLMLDVKGDYSAAVTQAFAEAIKRAVAQAGAAEVAVVCGQNWFVVDRVREAAPDLEVRYSLERPQQWSDFMDRLARGEDLKRVNIEHGFLDGDKARFLQENGVDVYCWTVDDAREASRLLAAGADGIISNDLDLLAGLGGRRAYPRAG